MAKLTLRTGGSICLSGMEYRKLFLAAAYVLILVCLIVLVRWEFRRTRRGHDQEFF